MLELDNVDLNRPKKHDIREVVEKVIVKHAYCEECGEELVSQAPPMFNPFTFERICKHTCTKCGKVYNLDFAYPRLAFINNKVSHNFLLRC